LTPHSPGTGQINTLIWIGFFAALLVVVAINLGLLGSVRRWRGGRGKSAAAVAGKPGLQMRVAGGLSGFAIILFVLGIIFTSNALSTPKTTSAGLTSLNGKDLEGKPLVIKATGQQWLWRYNYPNGSFSYWKLVIPVDTAIELKLESTDVIHTWNVPDLAPKVDATPGKTTHVLFRADAEGEFYGVASTLSGQAYAPMRTTVEVVSPERFEEFIKEQQKGIKAGNEAAEKIEAEKLKEEAAANPSAESSEEGEEPGSQTENSEEAEAESAEGEEGESKGEEAKAEESEGEESAEGAESAALDPEAGKEVFAENCSVCHGADGLGGSGGPDLTTMPLAKEQAGAEGQVTNGGGGMPAFGGTLSEEEIANVAAYVVEDIVGGK
jgi:heme/copper-type cytochrome/quinol oxidase subunit 2/mono/diheme cytochrome c family protein